MNKPLSYSESDDDDDSDELGGEAATTADLVKGRIKKVRPPPAAFNDYPGTSASIRPSHEFLIKVERSLTDCDNRLT